MPESEIHDQAPAPVTKGVQTLLGNPKKAIIKLSIPMIVAMSVHTLYSFVDGLWVAGLGPDALSASNSGCAGNPTSCSWPCRQDSV